MKIRLFIIKNLINGFKRIRKRQDILFLIIGLVISVATLTTTIMLFEGYENALKKTILNFNGHIFFFKPGAYDLSRQEVNFINDFLDRKKEVLCSQPVIMGQGMAYGNEKLKGISFRSIRWQEKQLPMLYHEIIKQGSGNLDQDNDAVIGSYLAKILNVTVGDTIALITSNQDYQSNAPIRQKSFKIKGIFHTGMHEYDTKTIFINETAAKALTLQKGAYSLIEIKLNNKNIEKASDLALKWDFELENKFQVSSWSFYNGNLFSLLKLEKWVIAIILSFLIVIASFNIITSTTTTITEDRKKIAILRTIGLNEIKINTIYVTNTFIIGLFSIIIGLGTGYILANLISNQSLIKMHGEVYLLDAFHVSISWFSIMIIFTISLLIVLLSGIIALKKMNQTDIISVLRYK